jgi:hypothetical protein
MYNGSFTNAAGLLHSLDANLQLVDVVQGIEDAEDIDTVLLRLLNEVVNSIVGQRRVGDTVGSTEEHLERDVGNGLAHLPESVPRILVQEAVRYVESGTAPALQTVHVGESMAGLLGDIKEIDCADTRGQKGLVGITPGGIHEQAALVVADSLGESLGTLIEDDLPPTLGGRRGSINLVAGVVKELRDDNVPLELGLADLTLDAASVHSQVAQVREQLLGAVLATNQVEELRGLENVLVDINQRIRSRFHTSSMKLSEAVS